MPTDTLLPGDLLRAIRARAYEPGDVHVFVRDTGDESDDHRAMLYCRDEQVCGLPVGFIPWRNQYVFECPVCKVRAGHPWVCRQGLPPQGIERRGMEFLAEPTGQGHQVFGRLVRRGAEEILGLVTRWRSEETGRPLVSRRYL